MSALADLAEALTSDRFSSKALADGSGVLIDVRAMRVLSLNVTGMFVVSELQEGTVERTALIDRLTAEFEVDPDTAAADLDALIHEFEAVLEREEPA